MDDLEFSPVQHKTWAELFQRQLPKVRAYASRYYLRGFDLLAMPSATIPTLDQLNSKITPATGWTIVRTDVRYTEADEWYVHFDNKEFLITNYMRSWEELDWTPEPDMFHDIFGHLPFFVLPEYVALQELFAPAYLANSTDEEKENIKRLAWFSTEFGVIREDDRLKIFGTGLMSGGDEMLKVVEGDVRLHEFSVRNVIERDKTLDEQHDELFVFDSLERLHEELAAYLAPIAARGR